jgi:hypothetical protein
LPTQLQLASDGRELRVIATAPIDTSGAVSASAAVDLSLAAQSIAKSTHSARLVGVTPELTLVSMSGAGTGTTVSIPTPSTLIPNLAIVATLEATPDRPAWLATAPLVGGGIAALLLVIYGGLLLSYRRHA